MAAGPTELTSAARRIVFRLDDGSLLGHSQVLIKDTFLGAMRLSQARATIIGRSGEADVQRVEELLAKIDPDWKTSPEYVAPVPRAAVAEVRSVATTNKCTRAANLLAGSRAQQRNTHASLGFCRRHAQ